jgi:N-acetylmuramoyl-L-alanine amidase
MKLRIAFMAAASVAIFAAQSSGYWVVVIDPGHGGPGASQYGPNGDGAGTCGPTPDPMSEQWVNLQVGLRMKWIADNDLTWGAIPKMTRENETEANTLAQRVQIAKDENAYYFLSIHHNGDDDPTVQGTEVFWSDSGRTIWGNSQNPDSSFWRSTNSRDSVYAMKVLLRLIGAWGYTNRCDVHCGKPACMSGCDESEPSVGNLFVLNHNHTSYCALSEASFITNTQEEWRFLNDWSTNHITSEANALYTGTRSHFNMGGIAQLSNSYVGGSGGQIAVDEITHTSPIQFAWEVGEQHALQVPSMFVSGSYYYYFHHWAHLEPSFLQPTETHDSPDWYITVPLEFDFHIYRAYFTGGPYECAIYEPYGGRVYDIGDTLQIIYTCDAGVENTTLVDVSLDRNNGRNGYPEVLAQDVPYEDGVRWVINGPVSDSCLMKVAIHDFVGNSASAISENRTFKVKPCSHCGDANSDGSIDISDIVFLIAHIFLGGAAPADCNYRKGMGDANGDGSVDISDVVYLVAYIFTGGRAPRCQGMLSSTGRADSELDSSN